MEMPHQSVLQRVHAHTSEEESRTGGCAQLRQARSSKEIEGAARRGCRDGWSAVRVRQQARGNISLNASGVHPRVRECAQASV